jgi:hypothetical protein
MEKKIYLEEFLERLTIMVETSTTEEQVETCVKYVENYKLQLTELIENQLFREATLNFLDELIKQIYNEGDNRLQEEEEKEVLR